jgi:sucrose-6-phosphate hydrolase SacC (GH32 family)
MTVPRELFLMEYNGSLVMGSMPAPEVMEKCAANLQHYTLSETKPTLNVDGLSISLNNDIITVKRESEINFNDKFNVETSAALDGRSEHNLLILRDDNSVEIFVDGGAVAMTFLIF